MRVRRFDNPVVFASATQAFLLRDEARHNFLLAMIPQLSALNHPLLAMIENNKQIVAVGVMPPGRQLSLSGDVPDAAIDALADELARQSVSVPGIQAMPKVAERFAQRWCERLNVQPRRGMTLGLYALERIIAPPAAEGHLRLATPQDIELLSAWANAFGQEVGEETADGQALAASRIKSRRLFLWECAGAPVSMAAWTRPTPNGCAINLVYTPPPFRRRGYASNCVAALSQKMLDDGKAFCTLYTDLANPTSNKIYRQLGYQLTAESQQIWFDLAERGST